MPIRAIGGAPILSSAKAIRLARYGCANRPFFHIVVMSKTREAGKYPVIEQLGTYDPLTNMHGERLVSLNLDRLTYWIGARAEVSPRASELLGLCGYFPVHPRTYMSAWRARVEANQKEQRQVEQQ